MTIITQLVTSEVVTRDNQHIIVRGAAELATLSIGHKDQLTRRTEFVFRTSELKDLVGVLTEFLAAIQA